MAALITALLTYGPLGIISGVLLKMYMEEKKSSVTNIAALNAKIVELVQQHAQTVQDISEAHILREKEVNQMLKDYGQSVVDAVDQNHKISERLWSIRK